MSPRDSAIRALVSNAASMRSARRDLAALLGVEAHRLAPSAATESALLGVFTSLPGIGTTRRFDEAVFVDNEGVVLPDGRTIAGVDVNGNVHLIDISTGNDVRQLGDQRTPTANVKLAVSADGHFLAVAVADAGRNSGRTMVNVWDLRTHQGRLVVADLPVAVGSIAISHDGSQVAIGGAADGRIQLRDARTGELQHELDAIPTPRDAEGRSNAVALAYLDDGRLVVSSLAGRIRFVDPATGHVDGRIFGPAGTSEAAVLIDGAARSMVTMGSRGIMRYELPSGRPLWSAPSTLRCESGAWIAAELDVVLCGEAGGRVVGVDLATGTVVSDRFDTQRGNVHLLSSDGTTLLGLANEDSYTVWRLDGVGLITHTVSRRGGARVLDYLPGHDLLLIAGVDPETRNPVVDLVDTHSGQRVDRFDGAVDARTAGPGRAVVRYDDGTLASYDVDREPSTGPRVHAGATFDDFAAIGDRAYVWQRDGQVRQVDLVTGVVSDIDIADPADLRIVIDANTEELYTLSGEALQRRNPTSGQVLATADVPHVANIAVRGRTLIANTADGELAVLDADTLVATGDRFAATTGAQPSIELDGGGLRIVTQGSDGSVRFYDVASGTQLGTELGFGIAAGAAISDDGLQAAIATDAGIVIWDLDPTRWTEAACELAGRNLTQAEWDTYIGDLGHYRPTCPDVT